jgi:hypothetical protein
VNEKSGENTPKIIKKKKRSIQLEAKIHTQRSTILRESNVYKVWKPPHHHAILWRIGGISHFLSYTMKHTHTSPKATMATGWERDGWILTSPPAIGVLIIEKLMTKLPLWSNTMKNSKVGVEESDVAHRIDLSAFSFISTRLSRWCHMHHPRLRQSWG